MFYTFGKLEFIAERKRKIASGFRLPYFTISPTFSVCPSHGYLMGKQEQCPVCRQETEVYARVVGYLRPVKQWNGGKQAEFDLRKSFVLPSPGAEGCKPLALDRQSTARLDDSSLLGSGGRKISA